VLSAQAQTVAWMTIFFVASAAASSAYLTVGEIFPLEMRALAIAFFYAVGTGLGGIIGPALFGSLIASKRPGDVAVGYVIGGALMCGAGLVEIFLGVDAEKKSLEDIAAPLSATEGGGSDGGGTRSPATRGSVTPTAWAPRPARPLPEGQPLPPRRGRQDHRGAARRRRPDHLRPARRCERRPLLGTGAPPGGTAGSARGRQGPRARS
jgi:MFS family permease